MKKNLLWLLAPLMMACIGAGCSEEEHSSYYIKGDKLTCNKGCHFLKYSPRDIKDYPDFLNVKEIESSDAVESWFQSYIWTGKLDGKRYYGTHSSLMSQSYGYVYDETGEYFRPIRNDDNWTDIEVIYIPSKYIEHCKKNNEPLWIEVP
ncbi:MAG: hypothetical protein K2I92_04200 [Muribaculaceae bacterium]|nr:hypothetical protein [Muribaculaceae bacterium]